MLNRAFATILLIGTFSCGPNTEHESPSQPISHSRGIELGDIKIDLSRSSGTLKNTANSFESYEHIFSYRLQVQPHELTGVLRYFTQNTIHAREINHPVFGIAFYLNDGTDLIEESDILSFSVFYEIPGGYYHSFFSKNLGGYSELEDLSFSVRNISSYDFDVLLGHSLASTPPQGIPSHVFLYANRSVDTPPIENQNEEVYPKLSTALAQSGVIQNPYQIVYTQGCSCPPGNGGCVVDEFGGEICEACAFEEVKEASITFSKNYDPYQEFPITASRQFRDQYLAKSANGLRYVDYYYKLSHFMSSNRMITFNNFWEHVDFAREAYSAANRLQNGNDSDIIITPSLFNQAKSLIQSYKASTKDPEITMILNRIEQELNFYNGKPKGIIDQQLFYPSIDPGNGYY